MKKLLFGTVALAVLAAPALAQKKDDEPLQIQEREKKQQAEQLDQQYKRTMERSRKDGDAASTRSDPWANMRAPNDNTREAAARMMRDRMIRFAAVLVGAAVLFGLEQQFGVQLYLAIPAAIAVYFATLIVLTLAFGSGNQTK